MGWGGWGVNTMGQGAVVDSILHERHFSGARNGLSGCITSDTEGSGKKRHISNRAPSSLSLTIVKYFSITHQNTYAFGYPTRLCTPE